MTTSKKFNTRAFTSLYMTLSGLFIASTGLVIYLSPAGRVAHWIEWRFIFLTKEQWQSLHTLFSFIFVIAVILHIYFNWKIFWSYLKNRVQSGIRMKRELGTAAVLTAGIFSLTLFGVPPFSTVMELGEYLTNSWSNEQTEPPVPHAEELTVKEYAAATGLELEPAMAHLTGNGIVGVDSLITMGELGELNQVTPKALSDLLIEIPATLEPDHAGGVAGVGYGRMTVAQIAGREGVETSVALERLLTAGIEAESGDNLRELADAHDLTPMEVVEIISDKG